MYEYLKKYIGWKCEFIIDPSQLMNTTGVILEIDGNIARIEADAGFVKKTTEEVLVNLYTVKLVKPKEQMNRYAR